MLDVPDGKAAALGYGEYRVHPALMAEIAATFSYHNGSLLRLKQGIWPKHLRDKRCASS